LIDTSVEWDIKNNGRDAATRSRISIIAGHVGSMMMSLERTMIDELWHIMIARIKMGAKNKPDGCLLDISIPPILNSAPVSTSTSIPTLLDQSPQ
jgi:hypothetical protein